MLIVGGALVVVVTAKVLMLLFAGVLLAITLRGAASALSRWTRLPPGLALLLILVLCAGATALAITLAWPALSKEIAAAHDELPGALLRLHERLRRSPFAFALGMNQGLAGEGASTAREFAGKVLAAVGSSLELLAAPIVVFFIGVYGAAQPGPYSDAALAVAPAEDRPHLRSVLAAVQHNLSRWLLGRLVAMVFVGVTTGIAFHLLGLPLALALGLFAGLMAFIEYAGAFISAIPPLLLALAKSPSTAVWVLATYTCLHVIEGYVLTPLLARATVRLPPAYTLALQIVFGFLLGPLGLTFSTPLLVVGVSGVKAWSRDEQ